MPSNRLIQCCPLLLLPSIFPSIRVFSSESALYIRWPKYWSFIFIISPSNEYSRLTSFRIWSPCSPRDSQESFPTSQFKSINSSVLSLLYSRTLTSIHDYWENHNFDYMGFVSKVMSLLLNMLSRFIIVFLPRSKHVLMSWLQSPFKVIFGPKKKNLVTVPPSICFPIYLPWSDGTRCYDLSFLNVEF